MRVMVVDDEPLVRLSLRRALEKHGHQVFEAADGQTALEKWSEFDPEVVYLDVLMPRLSGPDLLKALPEENRGRAKIILMSAFTGGYDLDRAKALGAELFVSKPFEDIFATVKLAEDLSCF